MWIGENVIEAYGVYRAVDGNHAGGRITGRRLRRVWTRGASIRSLEKRGWKDNVVARDSSKMVQKRGSLESVKCYHLRTTRTRLAARRSTQAEKQYRRGAISPQRPLANGAISRHRAALTVTVLGVDQRRARRSGISRLMANRVSYARNRDHTWSVIT